jgi:hypothetical protein
MALAILFHRPDTLAGSCDDEHIKEKEEWMIKTAIEVNALRETQDRAG